MQFLVMEFVEGEPISAILRRCGRIPERDALDVALQVSGALEEAASLGIIHRDVKPGNILMSKWGVPKLADFGIAKEFADIRDARIQQSLTMGVVGTPTYMSPEQARGARDIDFRSDIYSLGATLYHMAVGELPFPASTPQETMVRVVAESPRLPRTAFPATLRTRRGGHLQNDGQAAPRTGTLRTRSSKPTWPPRATASRPRSATRKRAA